MLPQIREKDQVQRIGLLESRSSRLEAQLFRANRRANERELESARVRARVQIRARTLAKALRDLRRQYAGSIPLAKQEKATKLLTELREEREEAWRLRKEAEVRASEAEQRAEELALKQEGKNFLVCNSQIISVHQYDLFGCVQGQRCEDHLFTVALAFRSG